ncbi:MAG: DUF6051 family protein [Spirochaetota bacterium]
MSGVTPYHRLYPELARRFDPAMPTTDLEPAGCAVEVSTHSFVSKSGIHSVADYDGKNSTFRALVSFFLENNPFSRRHFFRELESADRDIVENREFRYSVFEPKIDAPPQSASPARPILLLHGLNEKSWDKYLPWAVRLAEDTGRPVILFPLAFHMNRAPEAWANPREMMGVANERRRLFPDLRAGSFANAALSHRIQFAPQRFITSGLESYFNLVDLVRDIHSGGHPMFPAGTRVDLFGYSIGASISELLLMANRDGLFSDSRAFLLCGGSVLGNANPVSKAIMDDEAHRGLQTFLEAFVRDPAAALGLEPEKLAPMSREIEIVRSMILPDALEDRREWVMRTVSERITALVMSKDRVFHPDCMLASWRSSDGGSMLPVTVADPPYRYTHEQLFPPRGEDEDAVDRFFDEMIARAVAALGPGPAAVNSRDTTRRAGPP